MELLAVVGVIVILAGISFGVVTGVAQHSLAARAKSQLVGIAQALTQYKLQYGDYPQTDQPKDLFDALTGKIGPGPKLPHLQPPGKNFIANLSQLTVLAPEKLGSSAYGDNSLMDPWGNPYLYVYKTPPGSWTNPSYVLFSSGPDGKHTLPMVDSRGFPPSSPTSDDTDNIYEPALQ
jgi:type II secretory pathway pseudopilin PulG